jgi:hypothetical protein
VTDAVKECKLEELVTYRVRKKLTGCHHKDSLFRNNREHKKALRRRWFASW